MDPISVAQQYFSTWNRRDAAAIVATFVDGGTYSDPLAPGLTGPAIGVYAGGLWEAFPDLTFEIIGATLVGQGEVAAQWLMRGTNTGPFQGLPPTSRGVALPGADFIRVEGDRIRSVQGYFDSALVPRALGLQTIVQPDTVGPFRFGTSVSAATDKTTTPGAFSITCIETRDAAELERVRQSSRQIVMEMRELPGFHGFVGAALGNRLLSITAWDHPDSARGSMKTPAHAEAMKRFFDSEVGTGGFTSVWIPGRINRRWCRCAVCARMVAAQGDDGICTCGAVLPAPPPYW